MRKRSKDGNPYFFNILEMGGGGGGGGGNETCFKLKNIQTMSEGITTSNHLSVGQFDL